MQLWMVLPIIPGLTANGNQNPGFSTKVHIFRQHNSPCGGCRPSQGERYFSIGRPRGSPLRRYNQPPVTVTPLRSVSAGMRQLLYCTVSLEAYSALTKSCIEPETEPPETGVTVSPSCQ